MIFSVKIDHHCLCMSAVYLKMYKGLENVPRPVMFMIFINFFNGFWSKPFPENGTTVGDFFINSKDFVPVQFMHQTENYYYAYASEIDAKILRLPYCVSHFIFVWFIDLHSTFLFIFLFLIQEDKFSMTIILSNRRDDIDQLIQRINSSVFYRLKLLMKEVEVKVSIPKFNILNTVHLDKILISVRIVML